MVSLLAKGTGVWETSGMTEECCSFVLDSMKNCGDVAYYYVTTEFIDGDTGEGPVCTRHAAELRYNGHQAGSSKPVRVLNIRSLSTGVAT